MEDFVVVKGSKSAQYEHSLAQISAISSLEEDIIANMANICAILKDQFQFFWVGFYRVKNGVLKVGPYQGPLACTTIPKGGGICGLSWSEAKTIIVADVNQHPEHIACSSISQSEIVVPVYDKDQNVIAVLDIDSELRSHFDEEDQRWLEKIVQLLLGNIS